MMRLSLLLAGVDDEKKAAGGREVKYPQNSQVTAGMKKSVGLNSVYIDFNRYNFQGVAENRLMLKSLKIVIRMLWGIHKARNEYKKELISVKSLATPADDSFWSSVREKARELGIGHVGFARVDEKLMFKHDHFGHVTQHYPNAIVLSMEMDPTAFETVPGHAVGIESLKIYADLGAATNLLADFIRKKGHGAIVCHPLGDSILLGAMAVRANIGAFGRNGLLISKKYGPRQRLSMISTTADPLPAAEENAFQKEVADFCRTCGNCIRKCPASAIRETAVRNDIYGLESCVDGNKCIDVMYEYYGCGMCIKSCPFHKNESPFQKR